MRRSMVDPPEGAAPDRVRPSRSGVPGARTTSAHTGLQSLKTRLLLRAPGERSHVGRALSRTNGPTMRNADVFYCVVNYMHRSMLISWLRGKVRPLPMSVGDGSAAR